MIMTLVMTMMTMIIREGIEERKKKEGTGIKDCFEKEDSIEDNEA